MAYETLGKTPLNYQLCRYGSSKLLFRGPRKKLNEPYIAVLGGTETYGKFMAHPYPDLLQLEYGMLTVNFGCPNAGIDAFLHDHGLLTISHKAKVAVLQVLGAHNMSNRFYAVHPRRNDRFLRASNTLKDLYREIDFTEYSFTRHLLTALHDTCPDRFTLVEAELRAAWVARMKLLIAKLDCDIVLLWLADHSVSKGGTLGINGTDPLFVDQQMIAEVAPFVKSVVEVSIGDQAIEKRKEGLLFAEMDAPAAREMLGICAHQKASRALQVVLDGLA